MDANIAEDTASAADDEAGGAVAAAAAAAAGPGAGAAKIKEEKKRSRLVTCDQSKNEKTETVVRSKGEQVVGERFIKVISYSHGSTLERICRT